MDGSFFRRILAWLFVGALCLFLLLLSAGNLTERFWKLQLHTTTQTSVEGARPSLTVQGIIFHTNKAREEIGGLPPLAENQLLDAIAAERLKDMFEKQYFAHQSPSGEVVADLAYRKGYHYKVLAENLGLGLNSDEKMVQGWLQSPSHRENILRPECLEIGVAVGRGLMRKQAVWMSVQVFGLQSLPLKKGANGENWVPSPPGMLYQAEGCIPPDAQLLVSIQEIKNRLAELEGSEKKSRKELEESNYGTVGSETDRFNDKEAIGVYNKKVVQYNTLIREIQSKMEQYSQMTAAYNGQAANYNSCIKREIP